MQRLHELVESNEIDLLKQELESYTENIDVLSGSKDLSLLHLCAIKNRPECAEILLEAEANPSIRDEYNVEPLHYAASSGAAKVMEVLIEGGANLSALDNMKRSPLECAVRYNRLDAVKILLENHVNVNVKNKHGGTSLHQSAEAGNVEMVTLLLHFKADVNAVTTSRRTPLHYAAQKGHTEIMAILLDNGADVNATETKLRETPLHRAAASGSATCVELLLDHKADLHALNQNRRTPLHKACIAGNIDTLTCLIARGSAPGLKDKNEKTALESAINAATRSAFERALKEKRGEQQPQKKEKKISAAKIERDESLSSLSLLEIERENQKDILHLQSVFQAISKAAGDAESHILDISRRHVELIFRESEEGENGKSHQLRETVEKELKKLHNVLSEISQCVNSSQDAMEQCIFQSDSNLDSTYDATADWEADTLDDETQYSYDKLDQLTSHFSDSEEKPIKKPIGRTSSEPKDKGTKPKRKKSTSGTTEKKKKLKRSKSAKKMKITSGSAPLKRQSSDLELKNELKQLDKEQLIELALKMKEEETSSKDSAERIASPPEKADTMTNNGGMNKRLKHRIPSKTRLRIAPLSGTN